MEDDIEVMLIWDFNVKKTASLTAAQCLVKANTPNCADKLPIMPLMDLKKVSCICVNVDSKGKVVLESCEAASAADDLQKLSIAANYDDYKDSDSSNSGEKEDDNPEEFADLPLAIGGEDKEFMCEGRYCLKRDFVYRVICLERQFLSRTFSMDVEVMQGATYKQEDFGSQAAL